MRSGAAKGAPPGLTAFTAKFRGAKVLQVGGSDGVSLEDLLASEVETWLAGWGGKSRARYGALPPPVSRVTRLPTPRSGR